MEIATTTDLSRLADHNRAGVKLQTGLTYDGITPVRLSVSKRDRRYGVTDCGGAIAAAGASATRVAFPDRIPIGEYEVNVSRHGIVCLSAVAPTPAWLETICDIVGRGSVALYEELLDVNPQRTGVATVVPFEPRHVDGVVRLCEVEGWPSWTADAVEAAFSAPGVVAVVAEASGEVIGAAQLLTDGAVIAYLGLLVVAESARRSGVGRALVNDLFQRSGLQRMDLLSEEGSTQFYESLPHRRKPGYRLYREDTFQYDGGLNSLSVRFCQRSAAG